MSTLSAYGWLRLAAAPTFAIMALLTATTGEMNMHCSATPDASPINGMALMYLLMSAFHSAPWLRLIEAREFAQIRRFQKHD